MHFCWLKPYKVSKTISKKKIYILKELDDIKFNNIIVDNKLKKFYIQEINLNNINYILC